MTRELNVGDEFVVNGGVFFIDSIQPYVICRANAQDEIRLDIVALYRGKYEVGKQSDKVPSPLNKQEDGDHYKKMGIQPIELGLANNLDCLQFSAVKHIMRHPHKGEGVMDLKKAIHYLQMALELQYGVNSTVEYKE